MEPNAYENLKHLEMDRLDLSLLDLDLNLKPTEEEERKLRAISCPSPNNMNLSRDQAATIRSIEAAQSRCLWFRRRGEKAQGIKFSTVPPKLFWPQCCSEGVHPTDSCKKCFDSKQFFNSLGANYLHCINDILDSPASFLKIKPVCLQMVVATEFYKRHEISELAHHTLVLADTKLEESYKKELQIWTRLSKYILQMKQECRSYLGSAVKASTFGNTNNKLEEERQNRIHLERGLNLMTQCEKRIEEMAWNHEHQRILKNPKEFTRTVKLVEELFINRISNAAIMSDWINVMVGRNLDLRQRDYEDLLTAYRPNPSKLLRNSYTIAETSLVKFVPFKPCYRRHSFSAPVVTPYLPPPVSHLFGFTVGDQVKDIHPSWLLSLLDSATRKKLIKTLRWRNRELTSSCLISESEIERRQIDKNMKKYFINQIQSSEENEFPSLPSA